VRRVRAAVRVPVVAIGGISAANAADVIRAGADGICVVSAIVSAADPCAAAASLRRIVEGARHGA
jgi:thiamine-phosphate pyrophosphorylase